MNMFRTYQAPENAQPTAKGGIMFERNRGNSSQLATYISNATKFPGSLRSAHIRGQRTQAVPKCQENLSMILASFKSQAGTSLTKSDFA